MIENDSSDSSKSSKKFSCEKCNYFTARRSQYERHLETIKHKKLHDYEMIENDSSESSKSSKNWICNCGKEFKWDSGLYRHKKTCNTKEPVCGETQKTGVSDELVCQLVKDNTEMKKLFGDLVNVVKEKDKKIEEKDKKIEEKDKLLENVVKENTELTKTIVNSNLGGHHNNTINNNQQFNINMFLNEQCKDAINMTDFVKSIQVSFEQLDYTKVNGLEKGITKILIDNMNKLGKFERPLHCTDIKRETLYIKDDNKWEKDITKEKIKKAINKTSNKNFTTLCKWQNENKDFMEYDDKQAYYAKAMSNIGKPVGEVEDKIIKTICKENYVKE